MSDMWFVVGCLGIWVCWTLWQMAGHIQTLQERLRVLEADLRNRS